MRIDYWIWQSERLAVVLTKAVLAEASREEMKVEPLETQDFTKGEQKIEEQVRSGVFFFFLRWEIFQYICTLRSKGEVKLDDIGWRKLQE